VFESIELFVGQVVTIETLLQNLVALHYSQNKKALCEGEFSSRGEILDIFPAGFDSPLRIDFNNDKIERIASVNILTGKSIWQHKIVIILPAKEENKKKIFSSDIPLNNFVDIQKGDYVVHNYHGIGRYLGLKEFVINEKQKTHLVIEYHGGDKLFVPEHDIRLVQKYISFNKRPPRLYKLGTAEWKRVKSQIQKKIQHMAAELLHTQALRASLKGFSFSRDIEWQKEFEETFPFEETPDQMIATQKVKEDMEKQKWPYARLLKPSWTTNKSRF